MHVLYIFGFQYSLKLWKNSNSLEREFEFFEEMGNKFNVKYTLFTYGDNSDFLYDLPPNVKVIPIYKKEITVLPKFFDFVYSIIIPIKIFKNLKDIDLIKTNQLHGSWVAIIFKFLLKKPLFIRTGYDALFFSKKQSKNKFKQFIFYSQTFLALKFCEIYTVTSASDKKFLEKLFKSKPFLNKLSIRPNWIKNTEMPNKFFERSKDFISIGRLESQKNYHFLINSFIGVNQKLEIIGEGSQKKELLNSISKLKVNIEIFENINYNNLLQKLNEYKFFILSSKYEGNPKVLLEAMSMGCIPIVSDITNHTDIVSHGLNGFVFSLSSYSSLNTLLNSLSRFENLEEISMNARNHVLKFNSLSNSLLVEINDFELLMNNHK